MYVCFVLRKPCSLPCIVTPSCQNSLRAQKMSEIRYNVFWYTTVSVVLLFKRNLINVSKLLLDVCFQINQANASCCNYLFHCYSISLHKKWCHLFPPTWKYYSISGLASCFIRHAGACCGFRQTQLVCTDCY